MLFNQQNVDPRVRTHFFGIELPKTLTRVYVEEMHKNAKTIIRWKHDNGSTGQFDLDWLDGISPEHAHAVVAAMKLSY